MLLFFRQMFLTSARACVCVCVCVVHWHCTAQLSMFNMEKRFRNKIIIIIIIIIFCQAFALSHTYKPPRWPSGKASALTAEDPGFESRLRRDFFGVESYQ